jgi:hypothetical protein
MNAQQAQQNNPFRNSLIGFFAVLVIVTIFVVIVGLIGYLRMPVGSSIIRENINQPLGTATQARVELQLGATRMELDGAAKRGKLIDAWVETLAGIERLEQRAQPQGSVLTYQLTAHRPAAVREPAQWPVWSLHLNPTVPLELSVSGGMPASELNLRNLKISELKLSSEFARYTVTLPAYGRVHVRLIGGMGRMEVRLPNSMASRVQVTDQAAGDVRFNGQVLRDGRVQTSPDFETATDRTDLEVTTGLGHIVINRVP